MHFVLTVAQEALVSAAMKSGKWQKNNLGDYKSLSDSTVWKASTIQPNAMHLRVTFLREKAVEGRNIWPRLNAQSKGCPVWILFAVHHIILGNVLP